MYVCGITPYDATHLGHAATYLTFDLVSRVCRDAGIAVDYTQNVTDVDDPLLERALATGQEWQHIADRETELFRTDMTALSVIPPQHYESVTETLADVEALIAQFPDECVYDIDGDWYFSSEAVGQVCGWDVQEMVAVFAQRGGDPDRVGKRAPLDALLWRAHRPGEPSWPSRHGLGRPGWHIECLAIALRHATLPLDIQGGGRDLVFPHHDMCNAQALALRGQPLARVYMHAGLIGYQGEKMSKSLGNLVLVSQLRANAVDMSAVRLALFAGHWRDDREWTDELLNQSQQRLMRWRESADADISTRLPAIRRALRDDLNTPVALAEIDAACTAPTGVSTAGSVSVRAAADALLGVKL